MKRKILSILLCIAMIASLFSNVGIVFATDADTLYLQDLDGFTKQANGSYHVEGEIDLGGNTYKVYSGQITIVGDCTFKNGTIDITGTVGTANGIFYHAKKDTDWKFLNINFIGDGYSSAYAVLYNDEGNLIIDNCTFDLKNEQFAGGGIIKNDVPGDSTNVLITNSVFNLENVGRVFTNVLIDATETTINATVTLADPQYGTLTNHAFRNVGGTFTDCEINVSGYETGWKNTDYNKEVEIKGNSKVVLTDNKEGDLIINAGDSFIIADTATVVAPQQSVADGTIVGDISTVKPVTGLEGEGSVDSPYLIDTLDELKWFRDDVNAGNTYSKKYIKLTDDINLKSEDWTPIGNSANLFQGNFDGGENVISNLTINGEKNYYNNPDHYVGLFGYIKNGGYVKNVTIENAQITGSLYVGAIIGRLYSSGVVENCHVKGDIDIEGYWYVGGIVGRYEYGSGVKNCSVAGTADNIALIEADYNAETNADEDGSYVGGILGFTTEPNPVVTIANNSVSYVNIYGVTRIGGISGIAHYGNIFSDNTVSNTNIYAIQSDTDAIDADTLGLIAGACQGTDENPVTFTNCTATDTTVYLNGEVIAVGEYGGTIGEQDPITNYVAEVDGVQYTDLQTAFSALTENSTLTLLANVTYDEFTEIKMPATLKNVTINGNGKTIKNAKIMSADGSTLDYDGLTFKNIVFDNTNIVITGWRASASFKNIAITGCTFKNIVRDSANEAALHINVEEDEAINGFTFTNNIIDGVSGGSNSGVYMAGTGTITFTDNVINNVAFRPILLQLADCDGVTDNVVINNNTFSGSAKGRLQVYGTEIDNGDGTWTPSGTDELTVDITKNIFKDITSTQQICTWGLNTENYDISHNYYDIDITENPSKIYWNNITPSDPDGLVELGVYPVYTELNEDGTINTESEYTYVSAIDLPSATVTDITKEELDSKNAPALTFAKKFTADEVDEPVAEFYGDWYADFVLTLNKEATFNANGNADGYLAGQYDEFGENWLSVPFEDVTLKAGEPLRIMLYASETFNKPEFKITYNDVLNFVKEFNCGIFFNDEYLAANPDLKITLELRIYDNEDESISYSIGDNYEFTAPVLPTGTLTNAYTSETGYWGECGGNAKESFEFKFYNDDTYMGITSLNNIDGIIDGDVYVSWNIKLDAESNTDEYWNMSWDIAPTVAMQPNRVEQWVDGVKVAECAIEPNWSDSLYPVVAAVTDADGKILSYVNNKDGNTLNKALANGGNTVVLLRDVKDIGKITIKSNVTLDGNGKTISGNSSFINELYKEGKFVIKNCVFKEIANGNGTLSPVYIERYVEGTEIVIENNIFDGNEWDSLAITLHGYGDVDSVANPASIIVRNNTFKDSDETTSTKRYIHYQPIYSGEKSLPINFTMTGNIIYDDGVQIAVGIWYADAASELNIGGNYIENLNKVQVTYVDNGSNVNAFDKLLPLMDETLENEIDYIAIIVKDEYSAMLYTSLQEAIDNANGATVKLIDNVKLDASITIAEDANVILDLNGKTISYTSDVLGEAMITNRGNLTINDTSANADGAIVYTYTGAADTSYGKGNYTINNVGTLTVNAGSIENKTAAMSHACYSIDNNSINSVATLIINGGAVVNENNYAIRQIAGNYANNITVNDGLIEGTRAIWIHLPSGDATKAPEVNLTITGGTLTATTVDSSDNLLAIYSYSYGMDMGNVTVDISGGTFIGDIALTGGKNKTNIETVNITGGTFTGRWGEVYSYGDDEKAIETITITGGTFATDEAEIYATDDGFEFVENENGTFDVVEAEEEDSWSWVKGALVVRNIQPAVEGKTRLLFAIGIDSLDYSDGGFEITLDGVGTMKSHIKDNTVWSSINVTRSDGTQKEYTVENFGGNHIMYVVVQFDEKYNDCALSFRAFLTDLDGNTTYSDTFASGTVSQSGTQS